VTHRINQVPAARPNIRLKRNAKERMAIVGQHSLLSTWMSARDFQISRFNPRTGILKFTFSPLPDFEVPGLTLFAAVADASGVMFGYSLSVPLR
jgi:hypothetical protein